MTAGSYLDTILEKMVPTHNILRDYDADGRIFPAYAGYEASAEKYVLTRKANLWKVSESEHVLFMTVPPSAEPEAFFDEAVRLVGSFMEPAFSRGHAKYPPKDHMRTFLSVVLVSEQPLGQELIRKIRRYRYEKSYLFSLRGYAQGRLIAVDLPVRKVYTSPAAKDVAAFYRQVL